MIGDVVDVRLPPQQLCPMFKVDADGKAVCFG
jgi:hypothetical protein